MYECEKMKFVFLSCMQIYIKFPYFRPNGEKSVKNHLVKKKKAARYAHRLTFLQAQEKVANFRELLKKKTIFNEHHVYGWIGLLMSKGNQVGCK